MSMSHTTDTIHNLVDGKIIVTKILRTYFNNNLIEEKYQNSYNELHRDSNSCGGSGPAFIIYAGNTRAEYWYRNGKLYLDEESKCCARYYKDDVIVSEITQILRDNSSNHFTTKYVHCANDITLLFVDKDELNLPNFMGPIERKLSRYVILLIGVRYDENYAKIVDTLADIFTLTHSKRA